MSNSITSYSTLVSSVKNVPMNNAVPTGSLLSCKWPGYVAVSIVLPEPNNLSLSGTIILSRCNDQANNSGYVSFVITKTTITASFTDSKGSTTNGTLVTENKFLLSDLYSKSGDTAEFWVFFTNPESPNVQYLSENNSKNTFTGIAIGYGLIPSVESTMIQIVPDSSNPWVLTTGYDNILIGPGGRPIPGNPYYSAQSYLTDTSDFPLKITKGSSNSSSSSVPSSMTNYLKIGGILFTLIAVFGFFGFLIYIYIKRKKSSTENVVSL